MFARRYWPDRYFAKRFWAKVGAGSPLNILLVGQSTLNDITTDFSGNAAAALEAEALSLGYSEVNIVNGCKDAAAVCFGAAGAAGAYLASGDATKGTVYTTDLEGAMAASGLADTDITFVVSLIGNTDAEAIQSSTITEAQHKTGHLNLHNLLASQFTNARIISAPIIADETTSSATGWLSMRIAQWENRNENAIFEECFSSFDTTFTDNAHWDEAGATLFAERLARLCAAYDGLTSISGKLGPSISAVYFNVTSQRLEYEIAHDAGTDFTVGPSHRGYNCLVNGVVKNPSANGAARLNATRFRAAFPASTFAHGNTVTAYYPYGAYSNRVEAQVLIDNASDPMCLRESFEISGTDTDPESFQRCTRVQMGMGITG